MAFREIAAARSRFYGDELDGCIGPETLGASAKADPTTAVDDLAERQAAFYRSLAEFAIFGEGWLNRCRARRGADLAMIEHETTTEA